MAENVIETVEATEILQTPQEVLALAKVNNFDLAMSEMESIINDFSFSEKIRQIKDFEKQLSEIQIKDENDFESMDKAGMIRKALVKIRTGADKDHKRIKESSRIKGLFIDALKNTISSMEEDAEKIAKELEETGERIAQARRTERIQARSAELNQYEYNHMGLDLANMPDEQFAVIVEDAKLLQQAKIQIKENRLKEEREAFENEQRKNLETELQRSRLTELNQLGLIYSNDDLGRIDEVQYLTIKSNLFESKKETEKENEKIRQQNEQLKQKAEEERLQHESNLKILADQAAEEKRLSDAKIAEQQKIIDAQKPVAIEIKTPTAKKKNTTESTFVRSYGNRVLQMSEFKQQLSDKQLERVVKLYSEGIQDLTARLNKALDEYEK